MENPIIPIQPSLLDGPQSYKRILSDARSSEKKCAISDERVAKRAAMTALEQAMADCDKYDLTAVELCDLFAASRIPSHGDRTDSDRFEVPPLNPSPIGFDPFPDLLSVRAKGVPLCLRRIPAWVTWRMRWRETDGRGDSIKRYEKMFFNPDGSHVYATSPRVGGRFEDAAAAFENYRTYPRHHDPGIGFALKNDYEIVAIDLDDVINPRTGEISPVARSIVEQIDSYTEVSPTMRGLRIFAYGSPLCGTREKIQPHGSKFGIYSDKKVVSVTGHHLLRHTRGVKTRYLEIHNFYTQYLSSSF